MLIVLGSGIVGGVVVDWLLGVEVESPKTSSVGGVEELSVLSSVEALTLCSTGGVGNIITIVEVELSDTVSIASGDAKECQLNEISSI